MLKSWVFHETNSAPESFALECGVSPLLARVLWRRGFRSAQKALEYLRPDSQHLADPSGLPLFQKAAERVRRAIESSEEILLFGDYDVDGMTGCAILDRALTRMGARVRAFIPDRIAHGYGLRERTLKIALGPKTRLVITVDTGITAVKEVRSLNERGIDVVIADHHNPQGEPPEALAILCGQPLAGCGIAWKLAWALLKEFELAREYLDLAAIGTVADVVPLTGENRVLVGLGLRELERTQKPGLRALLIKADLNDKELEPRHVSFMLAPRLNAAGRIGSVRDAYNLLVTENEIEAVNLAGILEESNRQRQKLEDVAYREALSQVEAEHHFGKDRVLVVSSSRWHEGIVGILAARLAQRYYRPAFVLATRDGYAKGSGRSIPDFLLFDHLSGIGHLCEEFGGHSAACGVRLKETALSDFRKAINSSAGSLEDPGLWMPKLSIDAEARMSEWNEMTAGELGLLKPYGMGNPEPLFLTRSLRVKTPGSSGHTLWIHDAESGTTAEAVFDRKITGLESKTALDIVYQPRLEVHDGISSLKLKVADFKSL